MELRRMIAPNRRKFNPIYKKCTGSTTGPLQLTAIKNSVILRNFLLMIQY
jgi:hypothetical protein